MTRSRFLMAFTAGGAAMAQTKRLDMVKAAEKAWAEATTKNDKAALAKLLTDDLTYTHSNGDTDTKQVFIDNLSNGVRKYSKIDYESMEVREYGATAILTGAGKFDVTTRGQQALAHLKFIHVWVFRNGAWQLAAHQSLRLAN